jgi:superfamily II DNA or RNA helicase
MSAQPALFSERDPRRRYTPTQKQQMALRDGSRCAQCGIDLDPRAAHGAHIQAHSLDGPTIISNGALLCPPCNLKAGKNPPTLLRKWQLTFHRAYGQHEDQFFLLAACPGAGKTIAVKHLITQLRDSGQIGGALIVVPSIAVGLQWTVDYLDLAVGMYDDGCKHKTSDYFGMALTYAMLAKNPGLIEREISRWERDADGAPVLLVLDEMHHCGDARLWGEAIKTIAGTRRVLGLSGTPWRSGGDEIPYVKYNANGSTIADYAYTMADALLDGGVLRRAHLVGIDGRACIVDRATQEIVDLELSGELPEKYRSPALRSALEDESDVLEMMLDRANSARDFHREVSPYKDNAVLVVAKDKNHASAIEGLIKRRYNESAVVVHSDVEGAQRELRRAKHGDTKWIVAIQMIAEGVDINRISVVVYASAIATKMFWMQVVGRALRIRPNEDVDAVIVYPDTSVFNGYAAEIEDMVPEALKSQLRCAFCGEPGYKICPDCRDEPDGPPPPPPPDPTPVLPAEDATLGSVRVAGQGDALPGSVVLAGEEVLLAAGAPIVTARAAGVFVAMSKGQSEQKQSASRVVRDRPVPKLEPPSKKQRVDDLKKTLDDLAGQAANRSFAFVDARTNAERKRLRNEAFRRVNANINRALRIGPGQRDRLTELQLEDAIIRCEEREFDLPLGWEHGRG